MRKIVLTIILAISIVALSSAQEYKNGIGFRAGLSQGLTFKHFVSSKGAFEGLLATRWGGFEITGLYEVHNTAFEVDHLKWYYGGGVHIGSYNGDKVSWGDPGTSYTVIGIDGILGIEYSFNEAPINIGIDWKPSFNFVNNTQFWPDGGAISIRYVF